jgi:ABC-2 type transport system ATP-binding protein
MGHRGGLSMIRVEQLSKRYGDLRAVDGISFEIREGEIYGLLGPNGAVKTTTLSMISGLLAPDEGRVLFEQVDLADDPLGVKRQLGVVPQEVALYEELTGRENLRFWAGMYGLRGASLDAAVERALDQVGLPAKADVAVQKYSGGMKRRLNLSLGLVHEPRVVLLDEPTVGIDPQARQKILEIVERIADSGTTVLYTTHYLEEAERFCTRIGIMDHGKILAEGTLEELKHMLGESQVVTVMGTFGEDTARSLANELEDVRVLHAGTGRLVVTPNDHTSRDASVRLLERVLGGQLPVEDVSIQPPSLNGLFLKLTGRELRD